MIVIRDAVFSDHLPIARLHAANWRQHYRGIYSDHFLDKEAAHERSLAWHQRLSAPKENQQVLVALQGDTVVGIACLFLEEDPVFGAYLDNLHVSPSLQQSGVGKRLLQACAHRVLPAGRSLYLWVYAANEKARRVYEHLGAVHVETVEQPTKDGHKAMTCRYAWQDVSVLL